jgi:leucyl aminopeptidase (aminopeptidase T)
MKMRKGAEAVVKQCLNVQEGEKVVLVNDGNDPDIIEALKEVVSEEGELEYHEYQEPDTSGTEPPEEVAEAMKDSDVFIAPTLKSLSHTEARIEANEAGARGATLPNINKQIWNTALQADYHRVEEITQEAYSHYEDGQKVRITSPSGTDFELEIWKKTFYNDTGILHDSGEMGNLPAGEVHGGIIKGNGKIVVDTIKGDVAPEGTVIHVEDSRVVDIEHPEGVETSELAEAFEDTPCSKNMAEFGFGTNPEAELIGRMLQDEKVLGTVHLAFGDNTHYIPEDHERHTPCDIHWDAVIKNPTVRFGDKVMLDEGEPVFLDD